MEYLQILQNVLIAVGGGNGDPHTEYVRHVLPMVMWASLYIILSTLHPRTSKYGRWFLVAIACAYLFEQTQLVIKASAATNVVWAGTSAKTSSFGHLIGPISGVWVTLTYCLLSFVTCRFIRSYIKEMDRPIKLFYSVSFLLVVLSALVSIQWWYTHRHDVLQAFEGSVNHQLLNTIQLVILVYAVRMFWLSRDLSYVSRIAWVPFAFFLFSELFETIGMASNREVRMWLLPIANNLQIWAIPWFGLLFWRSEVVEQRRLTLRLHQAERLDGVGRLAAGVAHDFNNHLQAILGYATVGALDSKDNEKHRQLFNSISESVGRASVLVKLLTDFKREPAANDLGVVKLSNVLSELKPLLVSLLGPSIKLDFNFDPRADTIHAERAMLEQVIVNAVVNARDAMPDGGFLTIMSRPLEADASDTNRRMVRIIISDTGEGLSASEKSRVFEPFYTTKGSAGGSGLGLTASLAAVQRMDGNLEIVSEVGLGTKLVIELPASDIELSASDPLVTIEQDDNEEVLVNASLLSGTERVLLADDEPSVRHVVASYLRRAGYDVVLAKDGQQALEILASDADSIDLMVLDVLMPIKCGYATYEAAKNMYSYIPVIFITSQFDMTNCKAPQEPHLIKPFTQQALLQVSRALLSKSENSKSPINS